ncbi:unnamed protein product [Phytomonas sp. Hart1]|nr:unnamed protein product [Phytomonas sp. Hart1]|eukprot:CCW71747.1 unnamed protein product [Phytomonas sp. isolate Hart1]
MLARSLRWRYLASLAAQSAAAFSRENACSPPLLWIDDEKAAKEAYEAHIQSPEYKELHRPALTTSEMGLFGGEPGFEKSYRVWVDPDRPHMKHIYNQTALAKNLRYSRYGYFKRDMHLLDVDKLIRHARLLPTPRRLLGDFIYQRVPLSDKSCSAFIRYQLDQIRMMAEWERVNNFIYAEEMFERMIVTNIPPVEVGIATHAEMIRCCAVCRDWNKGWNVYTQRAREIEAEETNNKSNVYTLDTNFFDSVLELCVACEKFVEGMQVIEESIQRHLKPRASMLEKTMLLTAIATERLDPIFSSNHPETHPPSGEDWQDELSGYAQRGLDAWALYDFYRIQRPTESVEAYIRMVSMLHKPAQVLEALGMADAAQIHLSLPCYYWAFYAIRSMPDFGGFIMDVIGQLALRGLTPDYLTFTTIFMYCAVQHDGELALSIYQQFVHENINPTPEMVLLFEQACVRCKEPRIEMLLAAEAFIERLEAVGSSVDHISKIYDQYMDLAAHVGAVGSAFSKLKKLMSYGKELSTRQMNSLLLANSNASPPTGGASMTDEIVNLFNLLNIAANDDTVRFLNLCQEAFGTSEVVNTLLERIEEERRQSPGMTLGSDEDIPLREDPPHRLRHLATEWRIRPRDTVLKRYGQMSRHGRGTDVGRMIGSTIPFGRYPGERVVR